MEVSLEQLFSGKATRIKDKEYFTPEAYVTPFINRVSKLTDDFIINVSNSCIVIYQTIFIRIS